MHFGQRAAEIKSLRPESCVNERERLGMKCAFYYYPSMPSALFLISREHFSWLFDSVFFALASCALQSRIVHSDLLVVTATHSADIAAVITRQWEQGEWTGEARDWSMALYMTRKDGSSGVEVLRKPLPVKNRICTPIQATQQQVLDATEFLDATVGARFNPTAYLRNMTCRFACRPMWCFSLSLCCNICCCPCRTCDLLLLPVWSAGASKDALQRLRESRPQSKTRVNDSEFEGVIEQGFYCTSHVASTLVYAGILDLDPRRVTSEDLMRAVRRMKKSKPVIVHEPVT